MLSFKDASCAIPLFFWKLITEKLVNGEINQKGGSEGKPISAFLSLHCVFSDNVCNELQISPSLLIKLYCLFVSFFFLRKTGKDGQFGKKTIINVKMKIVLQNVPKEQPIV